jgi:hypothetical protein
MSLPAGAYPKDGAVAGGLRVLTGRWTGRRLAWLAIAGQAIFVATWVLAGALEPGYSHVAQAFSELGARDAAHPGLMNAGLLVLGVSVAVLAPALLATLPGRPASRVAAAGFAVAGAALVAVAFLPLDCSLTVDQGCIDRLDAGELSWRTYAHLWVGMAFNLAFVLTPFAIARALWPRHAALLALLAAGSALPILVATLAGENLVDASAGLAQRLGFLAVHAWVVIVAVGILHATRAEPEAGELIPMRPRDFFGRAWSGHGELTFWPPFLWRRAPRRFRFDREVEWVTDEVWLVEDRVAYADGEVERWRMVAQLAGPDRVHVMGDRVPGGADLLLEEDGYRMAPYRFTVTVGPLRFGLRMRDHVRPSGPGRALEWRIRFTWLGLPVARLVGVVSPVGDDPPEG